MENSRRTCVGTPYYIAPEVVLEENCGYSVDIWSLGCCVLELATGYPPFYGMQAVQAMYKMVEEDHPPLTPQNMQTPVDGGGQDPATGELPQTGSAGAGAGGTTGQKSATDGGCSSPGGHSGKAPLSPELTAFLMRCWIRDPLKRPNATELLKDPFIKKVRTYSCTYGLGRKSRLRCRVSPLIGPRMHADPPLYPLDRHSSSRQHLKSNWSRSRKNQMTRRKAVRRYDGRPRPRGPGDTRPRFQRTGRSAGARAVRGGAGGGGVSRPRAYRNALQRLRGPLTPGATAARA
jgi:serine/threonine protein kinase